LKTEKTYTDDHQVKLKTEVEGELVDQFKRRAARKIAQSTRIPGFRPGKAPYNMVLSYVGEDRIFQEAIDLLVEDIYPKILDSEEIKPWGPGSFDNIASEDPLVLEFTVPLDPEVELKGVDQLSKAYDLKAVTDEEVEEFVMSIRRNYANIVPLESPAAEGNVVYMTVEALDKNAEPGKDPVILKSSPQQTLIPTVEESRAKEWPFEGFAREFIGKKEGDTFTLEHQYPENHDSEEFAGKSVVFNINLQSVKALELPELDEEFLKNSGGFTTSEELYAGVREHLDSKNKEEYDDAYYLELVDRLRQASVIKYPPQMLKDEEKEVLHRIEHDLEHRNLNLDLYLKLRKLDREQFNAEEVQPTAKNRIERSLIMDAITKHYDIKISNEELEKEVSEVVNNLITSGEFAEAQKSLGSKKFSESVSMQAANQALENSIRRKLRELADPEDVIEIKAPETTESPAEETAGEQAEKE
jgi:trigger factor